MTAEVAVMNKLAIALAADSAVTFGDVKQQKIYNAANKLFSLSKRHPVGVMIYGSAEIMRVPWETILKMYRDELGATSFPRLSDYFDHLIKYLDASDRFFDASVQELFAERMAGSYYFRLRGIILERIEQTIEAQGKIDEKEVSALAESVLVEHATRLDQRRFGHGLDEKHLAAVTQLYREAFVKAAGVIFQKLPLGDKHISQLVHIAASLFCRDLLPNSRSGIVVAGFGTEDHFPSLRAAELDVRMGGKLHYNVTQSVDITPNMGAVIVPFAQSDVVNLFVEGIDSNYEEMLSGYLAELFAEYPDELLKALPALSDQQRTAATAHWKQVGTQLLEKFHERRGKYVSDKYVQPLLSVIEALPKVELAALAEAFVNLTSLKRRVSMDLETVGGPVDVAVISKGDGLVWIQRKHYFRPELNHQFFTNYFNSTSGTNG